MTDSKKPKDSQQDLNKFTISLEIQEGLKKINDLLKQMNNKLGIKYDS